MSGLLMTCPRCKGVWESRAISISDDSRRNTFENLHVVENCPFCSARVEKQGSWHVDRGVWRPLASALGEARNASAEDLAVLRDLLRVARETGATGEQVAEKIKVEAPRFGAVGDFLMSERGDRLAFWLAVLFAFLAFLKGGDGGAPTEPAPQVVNVQHGGATEQQIQEWVQQAIEQVEQQRVTQAPSSRCHCGSGKRYKRCCGRRAALVGW
jgi:hypothetical protein